jgi:mRNA-degrading endonuclease toxin of MazEF toxin-antitoxin module
MTSPRQGDIHYCRFEEPVKSRPVLVLSRTDINAVRENVVVALITRTVRGIPLEIPVGKTEGLTQEGVASLGDIYTVSKGHLSDKKGALSPEKLAHMADGLKLLFALS